MPDASTSSILRDRSKPDHARVGFVELFFDLVFVFAITQLSHTLLSKPTLEGALETGFLMLAVWVAWMWTTWVTSWLDPRIWPTRLLLFVLMGSGLIMSASLPEAFGPRGLYFALAYVFTHLVRTQFAVSAFKGREPTLKRSFERIRFWMLVSAVPWIAGGVVEGEARWALWLLGLGLDLSAPWWRYWTPGLGRSSTTEWNVEPEHMAERCALFVILSLGESIIILGATFAGFMDWTPIACAAFGVGFLGSAAMWWVYFITTAATAFEAFERHEDPGRVARASYTYAHIPLVAGIMLTAVADELVLAHPSGHASTATIACALGGPALFLVGSALFHRLARGDYPVSHLIGLALLGAGLPLGFVASPLALAASATGVVIGAAIWETRARARRPLPESERESGLASEPAAPA